MLQTYKKIPTTHHPNLNNMHLFHPFTQQGKYTMTVAHREQDRFSTESHSTLTPFLKPSQTAKANIGDPFL